MKRLLVVCFLMFGCVYHQEKIVEPTRQTAPIKVECDPFIFKHIEIEVIKMDKGDYQYSYKCSNQIPIGIYFVVKE